MLLKLVALLLSTAAGLVGVFAQTRRKNGRLNWTAAVVLAVLVAGGALVVAIMEIKSEIVMKYAERERALDRLYLMTLDKPVRNVVLRFHVSPDILRTCPPAGVVYCFVGVESPILNRGYFYYDCREGWKRAQEREYAFDLTSADSLVTCRIPEFTLFAGTAKPIRRISTIRALSGMSVQVTVTPAHYAAPGWLATGQNPIRSVDVVVESAVDTTHILTLRGLELNGSTWYFPEEWVVGSDFAQSYARSPWEYNTFLFDPNLIRPYLKREF